MLHAGAYLLLVLLWKLFFVFKSHDFNKYRSNLIRIALLCFVFGMIMELLQGILTSYRDPDWWDILANSTGVIIAVVFLLLVAPYLKALRHRIH
ncbi:hypothetical protein LPB144_08220 [Christiangramia salexigens]|uniref:VanZ-like domain-containing protein n=2 Tax=Christiangramia salexigens TaxID=1913577 RepID=A0A1L3J8I2_9FLAO|nr:hypothetical protein LPB144_08220 [Christiangramia salexigens]